MIPNLTKGAGIKGTALYVLHDERSEGDKALGWELTPEHQTAHRRGFTATRNLSTDDPNLAWRLMCQTAKQRDQLKAAAGVHKGGKPHKYECGHLSLSWEHQTRPDPAEMTKAAEQALKVLGWEKAQALIVEHRDHEHAHIHIVVNLIDPETGKVLPNTKNDHDRLQEWAHSYDESRGLRVCPNRAAKIEAKRDQQEAPPRREWLPRKEWEAQQAAKREAAAAEKRNQQGDSRAEALAQIKANAADQRDRFKPEWGALYKRQRDEQRQLEKAQRDQRRKMQWAIDKPAARAAMMKEQQAPALAVLAPAPKPRGAPAFGATVTPTQLTAVIDKQQATARAALEQRHAAEKTALAEKVEAARHEAMREVWKAHVERTSQRPQAAPERSAAPQGATAPANQNPQPQPAQTAAEREFARYAEARKAKAARGTIRPGAEDAAAKPLDPPRSDPHEKTAQDPATEKRHAGSAAGTSPANTNERDQRTLDFMERYAQQRRRELARNRDRGRERER